MLPYLFLLFAIAFRFIPHPMAFTPVGAALLFFGARASPPPLDSARPTCRIRRRAYHVGVQISFQLGSLRHLGVVRRNALAGDQSQAECGSVPDSRLRAGRLDLVLSGE